ncbi:MAG TPA: acyltransferase [Phycisphaerae bacterium]
MTITAQASAQTEAQPLLSRLSRVTTSGRFIPEIDGFRFIAIISVFILHDFGQVMAKNGKGVDSQRHVDLNLLNGADHAVATTVLSAGSFGVQLFFVISGFILGLPFAEHHLLGKKKPSLSAYLMRRVTRLEPPYLISLIVYAIALGLYYHWQIGDTLKHFGASVLYLHNQIYNEISTINGVAWSLEVEVQFYLLAPLLAYLFAIRSTKARRWILMMIILAAAALNNALAPPTMRYQGSIANAIQYFLAGFFLADLHVLNPSFLKSKHIVWDGIALLSALVMIVSLVAGGGPSGRFTFHLPICIILFYLAGFKSVVFSRFLAFPPIYLVGGMCYTIYLYHGLVIMEGAQLTRFSYLQNAPLWANFLIQFVLHASVTLAVCILLFKLIERPCMKRDWPQQLWRRLRGPALP